MGGYRWGTSAHQKYFRYPYDSALRRWRGLRLAALEALTKSIIYAQRKDVSYRTLICGSVWRITKINEHMTMRYFADNLICCTDGGVSLRLGGQFLGRPRAICIRRREMFLRIWGASGVFNRGHFCTALEVGGIFSKSRHIEMRMPPKSPAISAIGREFHIAEVNKRQVGWWGTVEGRVYLDMCPR